MARDLDGTGDYLTIASSLGIAAYPLSFSIRFNPDVENAADTLMAISQDDNNYDRMVAKGDDTNDPIRIDTRVAAGALTTATKTDFAAGVWQHAGGTIDTASRFAYLDGAAGTEQTGSQVFGSRTFDLFYIGAFGDTPTNTFNGPLAEAAVWGAVLTAAEMSALSQGFSPLFIKLASLKSYWPLLGNNSPENDLKSTNVLTVTGNCDKSDHPRVIMPFAQF